MITRKNLNDLYDWALKGSFPMKGNPTSPNYSNKKIYICQLKFVRKNINIRKKLMNDEIYEIYKNDEILNSNYAIFAGGTILKPHIDPDIYTDRYKRIQLPIKVPEGSYMLWGKEKITWKEGEPQCYPVMDYVHQASNPTDKPIEFLFLDVKMDTKVEL
jgi:aspartyl/asparaginyl beta-hydroxylase (cupin superfamily)